MKIIKYAPYVVGTCDTFAVLLSELFYIFKRIFLRIILGKKRRNLWFADRKCGRLTSMSKNEILIKNEQGIKYWIRPTEWDFFVVSTNCEPNVISKFIPKRGDVVFDVGANIGKYALHCGRLVGKNGKVYAFEPSDRPFELLSKSIKENNLDGVVFPINNAVSSNNGKSKLYYSNEEPITSLIYKLSNNFVTIDTITLDSFVHDHIIPRVDWIKIDVEGAEYDVLLGASQILKNHNPKLIFEVLKINESKVLGFLKSIGYSVTQLDSYHTEEFTNQGFANYFAQKSN